MKSLIIAVLASTILFAPLAKPIARTANGLKSKTLADATINSTTPNPKPKVVATDTTAKLDNHPQSAKPKVAAPATKKAGSAQPVSHAAAPKVNPVGCANYRNLFSKYNWNIQVAMAICQAESSGDPNQLSATCDRGLMQINCVHADMVGGNLSALYDPVTNIAVAYKIYSGQGWLPWTTYKTGAYLQYL